MLRTFIQDVQYTIRLVGRNPGFALIVVLTIALGIGTAASVFTVVDAVLLRPLPYPQPDRVVEIGRGQSPENMGRQDAVTFRALRERYRACDRIAASIGSNGNLKVDDRNEPISILKVTADYFEVLGVVPTLGSEFSLEDEREGTPLSVVLSNELWRSRFGADPKIIGESIRIDSDLYVVGGVMPLGFRSFPPRDAWVPLRVDFRGAGTNYQTIGRLRNGVTLSQAQREADALLETFRAEGFSWPEGQRLLAVNYQAQLATSIRPALLALLGAVGMVLLIACANVASLLMARAASRQREIALRAALGGRMNRIARQLLTESVVFSVTGGLLGLALAYWGVEGLLTLSPTDYSTWDVAVDLRVATVAVGISALTGLLFGMAPVIAVAALDVRSALNRGGDRTVAGGRTWARSALVVAESALCMVLLIGAALLIRSFLNLRNVELGFNPSNVVTARMPLEGQEYLNAQRVAAFYDEALKHVRGLPGVETAALASNLPVERGLNLPIYSPHGTNKGEPASVDWRYVSPEYFEAMGIPLLRGRRIEDRDALESEPVALVNQEFADRFFGVDDPIGASIQVYPFTDGIDDRSRQIIGVVGNVKTRGLAGPAIPTMFVPIRQVPDGLFRIVRSFFGANLVLRVRPGTNSAMLAVQDIVASIDSRQQLIRMRTMNEIVDSSLAEQRFQTTLMGVFAALALLMAAAGIYGLIAYSVCTRTREFGIRMALGASANAVACSVVSRGILLACLGGAFGIGGALFLTKVLQRFVFGVEPADPLTFAAVVAVLVASAAAASFVPAAALLKLDPAATLREE